MRAVLPAVLCLAAAPALGQQVADCAEPPDVTALVEPWEAIRWIALFRLALPGAILRYAGGREVTLGELQAMGMTSGINALIVGNYLTTLGRSAEEDMEMLAELQMPVGAVGNVI